jgi:hypothetical protein
MNPASHSRPGTRTNQTLHGQCPQILALLKVSRVNPGPADAFVRRRTGFHAVTICKLIRIHLKILRASAGSRWMLD